MEPLLIEYFSPADNPAAQLVLIQALTSAVNQLAAPLKALIAAVVFPPKGEGKEALVMREAVKLIRKETRDLLPELPETSRRAFETRLQSFENSLENSGPDSAFRYDPKWMKNEFDKLVFTLSLPAAAKDVYQHGLHGDPVLAAARDGVQQALADSFDEPVKSQLMDFMSMGRHFFLQPETTRVPVVFLQGPPATGKTYAARKIAKDVFDAELIEISMKELGEYLGDEEDFRFYPPPSGDDSFLKTAGKAWRQIIERTPTKNVVWFIDDQHHIQYPHWSAEKLAARADEYFEGQIENLQNIHKPESIAQTRQQVAELIPFILEEAAKHPPEKVTLRDIQLEWIYRVTLTLRYSGAGLKFKCFSIRRARLS